MTLILNAVSEQSGKLVPSNPTQYLALQVARRLSDEGAIRYYLVLFEHHPEDLLLQVFRRCAAAGKFTGMEFMRALRELTMQES